LTTKIHALVDALGNPCNLMLTPGQNHDLTCAQPLIENIDPGALLGDKAYDADPLIDTLNQRALLRCRLNALCANSRLVLPHFASWMNNALSWTSAIA
jgi:transposase